MPDFIVSMIPCKHSENQSGCMYCNLYHNHEQYRKIWFLPEPGTMPSITKMAVNFVSAIGAHVADGFKTASPEEIEKRKAICLACEFLKDDRCTKCGCFVNSKQTWNSSKCPINKW